MNASRNRINLKLFAFTAVALMFLSSMCLVSNIDESDAGYTTNAYCEGRFFDTDYFDISSFLTNVDVKDIKVSAYGGGGSVSAALRLDNDGKVYIRGGFSNQTSSWKSFGSNVKEIYLNYRGNFALCLTNDNKLYGAGSGYANALGGINTNSNGWTLIASNVASFSYDQYGGCALFYVTTSGDLFGSGDNSYGKQGSGNTTTVTSFTKRASNVSKVVAEHNTTYYITTSGDLYGAGYYADGASTTNTFKKVASNVRDVQTNYHNVFYVTTGNVLYGKGQNNYNQLGSSGSTAFKQLATNVSKLFIPHNYQPRYNATIYIATNGDLYGMGAGHTLPSGSNNYTTFTKLASNVRDAFVSQFVLYINNSNQLFGCGPLDYSTTGGSYWTEDDEIESGIGWKRYQNSFKQLASNVCNVFGCWEFSVEEEIGDDSGNYIYTQYISANVSIVSADTTRGTVSAASASIFVGANPTISGNKVTLGSTTITASPKAATAQYTFSFSSWQYYNGSSWVSLTNSTSLTSGMQIRAVFNATTNTYAVNYYDHNNAKITSYTENVAYNGTISHTSYSVSGKVFCGWYTESSHTNLFNSSTKITKAYNLYAYMVDTLAFTSSPVANATITYASGLGSVLFDALGSESAARYVWDFGDGSYGNEPVMYHHYEEPGTYDVSLSVYNYNGDVDTRTYAVVVYDTTDGPPREDNTLLIAGIFAAVILAGFVVIRPF